MVERTRGVCVVCGAAVSSRRSYTCSAPCKVARKSIYDRARYVADPDAVVRRAVEWQRANRDRKRLYDADYRDRTRERRLSLKREYSKVYQGAHPERGAAVQARRRARKAGNGVYLVTPRDLRRILERQRHSCVLCSTRFSDDVIREWDHIVPISRGGAHSVGNLQALCRDCNRTKSRRLLVELRYLR